MQLLVVRGCEGHTRRDQLSLSQLLLLGPHTEASVLTGTL